MATAQQTKTTTDDAKTAFGRQSVEDAAQRIRDLNERVIESSKKAGIVTLDAYEKSLRSLVEFEEKVGNASHLDWFSALASSHAKFVADISSSYTTAARDMLK